MNNTNEPVGSIYGKSTLERARFGPGMLLQHEDLEQLNTYTRDLNRLLFKSFFGCGVVCGLVVQPPVVECEKLKISINPGLALSCAGDPVYVPGPKPVDVFIKPTTAKELWVVLCGTTKCCAPRTTTCCSDDDEATSDCTRERDGFEIRLMSESPPCACACPKREPKPPAAGAQNEPKEPDCKCVTDFTCYEDHYAGICGCTCGECSSCDCKCIVLAYLKSDDKGKWTRDHSVRRFIRPVLMRDPQPESDTKDPAIDPQTAPLIEQLSEQVPEKEMGRLRETLNSFSTEERAQVKNIVELAPEAQRAERLRELLNKFHDAKLAPNVPQQSRNLTSQLAAELAEARQSKPAKPQKTK